MNRKSFILFIIIFCIYYIMPAKNCKNTAFVKINRKLDKEHSDIFKALDKLYTVCEKHWHTEEAMYKEGRKKLPKHHNNVTQIWREHASEHKSLLKQIKDMKKGIVKHIMEKDAPHFHWTTK